MSLLTFWSKIPVFACERQVSKAVQSVIDSAHELRGEIHLSAKKTMRESRKPSNLVILNAKDKNILIF